MRQTYNLFSPIGRQVVWSELKTLSTVLPEPIISPRIFWLILKMKVGGFFRGIGVVIGDSVRGWKAGRLG